MSTSKEGDQYLIDELILTDDVFFDLLFYREDSVVDMSES